MVLTGVGLGKRFGKNWSVRGVDLSVKPGTISGFLGPNGAGKTTTLRMLVGVLPPTEGSVTLDGVPLNAGDHNSRRAIGYLPEKSPLYLGMTPREQLTLAAHLKGLDSKGASDEIERVVGVASLETMMDRLIDHLSRGFRQRVALALALLGNPTHLLLDEPTTGLDPGQVVAFSSLLKDLSKEGTAILLSSHRLEVVERLVDEVTILVEGTLCTHLKLDKETQRPLSRMEKVYMDAVSK